MPMPTTRYGRYRFFRQRQRKRLKKGRRTATVHDEWGLGVGEAPTKREWDLAEFTKQMTRVYPLKPNHAFSEVVFPIIINPLPTRGRFGVVHYPNYGPFEKPQTYHFAEDVTLAFFRRLKSIPRIKHLPRKPWRHAKEDLAPEAFYPFDVYPSGIPSYRSTLPP